LETGLASSLACAISPRGGALLVGFRGCGKRCRNSEEFVEIVERILEVVLEMSRMNRPVDRPASRTYCCWLSVPWTSIGPDPTGDCGSYFPPVRSDSGLRLRGAIPQTPGLWFETRRNGNTCCTVDAWYWKSGKGSMSHLYVLHRRSPRGGRPLEGCELESYFTGR
jgi:hypothetical protein